MKAQLIRSKQRALLAKSDSNHWLVFDSGEKGGGTNASSSPAETMLMAAGGCTAMDQLFIIEKQRKQLTRYELYLDAVRAETHPKILRRIHFHAIAEGDCTAEQFKRAMELSLSKYCSVSLSLDRSVRLFASFELNGVEEGIWETPRNTEYYDDGNELD